VEIYYNLQFGRLLMGISSNRQSKNTSFSYGRSFVATCQKIWESFRFLPVLVKHGW
jgi:hypothetical protein